MYGVPESPFGAVEKENKTQYFKCIKCALDGLDNHVTDVFQVNGTIYCLKHAKTTFNQPINESITYVSTPNGPSTGFYVQND